MKSVYIHIPFCINICSYCDFSKLYYNKNVVSNYLNSLENEIENTYKNELIKTIYIGGGTPSSLNIEELKRLFEIIKIFKLDENFEFTFECNPENMNEEKIKFLKENKVNRVSIGVQSFIDKNLSFLGRKHNKIEVFNLVNLLKKYDISNINVDLIFGIKNQTIEDIRYDLDNFIKLDIPHISYYSLILEPNTKLYIDNYKEIDDDICANMYEFICTYLKNNIYNHYEISNFSKENFESKHNLVYWNNKEYYGFGLGAHSFINNIRYENTRSITSYLKHNYVLSRTIMNKQINIENELILGFRKLKGINKKDFKKKYKKDIKDVFDFTSLIKNGLIIEDETSIYINPKYIFVSNDILIKVLESRSD